MIPIPGSLSFVMSSARQKNLRDMPDARPKIHPFTVKSMLSHRISTSVHIRSAFFLRQMQLITKGISETIMTVCNDWLLFPALTFTNYITPNWTRELTECTLLEEVQDRAGKTSHKI